MILDKEMKNSLIKKLKLYYFVFQGVYFNFKLLFIHRINK